MKVEEYGKGNSKTLVILHGADFVHTFGKKYLLGQRVVVKVKGVDRMLGTVDFTIIDEDEN